MKITREQLESIVAEEVRTLSEVAIDPEGRDRLRTKISPAGEDKGKLNQLMQKAADATVGKIFKSYFSNKRKEKEKEAEKAKKKQQDKFDFADFEANFEPDDAARQAASTFTKSEYQPPAEAIKTCMVQGKKARENPDNPNNKRCRPSTWEKIGQAVKEPEPSYDALNQQFKDDGVADDVKDIMAKPPKVVDKYEKIMKSMEKNKGREQARKDAYEKKMTSIHGKNWRKKHANIGESVNRKGMKPVMEGWRRFVEGSEEEVI